MQFETIPHAAGVFLTLLFSCLVVDDLDEISIGEPQLFFLERGSRCLELKFPLAFRECADLAKAPGIVQLQGVCVADSQTLPPFHLERIAPSFGIPVDPVLSGCYASKGLSFSISRERLGDQVRLAVRSAPGVLPAALMPSTTTIIMYLDSDIPCAGRADEVGEMAGAVEVFRQNALDLVRLEKEVSRSALSGRP